MKWKLICYVESLVYFLQLLSKGFYLHPLFFTAITAGDISILKDLFLLLLLLLLLLNFVATVLCNGTLKMKTSLGLTGSLFFGTTWAWVSCWRAVLELHRLWSGYGNGVQSSCEWFGTTSRTTTTVEKYQNLKRDFRRLWSMQNVNIIAVVLEVLGNVTEKQKFDWHTRD